jgi:hypothetical protein
VLLTHQRRVTLIDHIEIASLSEPPVLQDLQAVLLGLDHRAGHPMPF